jgi:hypothetical protein
MSAVISPSLVFRTLVQLVHRPAKHISGRLSSAANHTGTFLPSIVSYSENDVNGAKQRCFRPSHRSQCALETYAEGTPWTTAAYGKAARSHP